MYQAAVTTIWRVRHDPTTSGHSSATTVGTAPVGMNAPLRQARDVHHLDDSIATRVPRRIGQWGGSGLDHGPVLALVARLAPYLAWRPGRGRVCIREGTANGGMDSVQKARHGVGPFASITRRNVYATTPRARVLSYLRSSDQSTLAPLEWLDGEILPQQTEQPRGDFSKGLGVAGRAERILPRPHPAAIARRDARHDLSAQHARRLSGDGRRRIDDAHSRLSLIHI